MMKLQHFPRWGSSAIKMIGIAVQSLVTPVQLAWRALRPSQTGLRQDDDQILEGMLARRGKDRSVRRDLDYAVDAWMNEGGANVGRLS